jgi:hypothetical protein
MRLGLYFVVKKHEIGFHRTVFTYKYVPWSIGKKFNFLAVPSKTQIRIVQKFSLKASVLDINTTLEKTHTNRTNTQCLVVLHSKQSQNLLRILAIEYEIPASIVHAVKGCLMSGP